jgi:cephalosporin-C deacetylase
MPYSDLTLPELESFLPEVHLPKDFDDFWAQTLASSRAKWKPPVLKKIDDGISELDIYDVTFSGFNGEDVSAWYILPRNSKPTVAVVEFLGYGGGRGFPHEHLAWPAAGFAYFIMDTRGQGSAWGSGGSTYDDHGSKSQFPGFMTKGIESKETYYYRRLFTDAVLAIDAVRSLNIVDPKKIAVTGISQGGGISLAVAGLVDDLFAVMPNVPFLTYYRRAIEITPRAPYTEITNYLSIHRDKYEETFAVLDYFDSLNFVRRAHAPAYFSVAMMDTICPPSTVFAAKNTYAGNSTIEVFKFNDHEGGQAHQWVNQVNWIRSLL